MLVLERWAEAHLSLSSLSLSQRSIHGIKNHLIWISNRGEIKDGSGMKFSESRRTHIEIKNEIKLNWDPKPKIDDTWR